MQSVDRQMDLPSLPLPEDLDSLEIALSQVVEPSAVEQEVQAFAGVVDMLLPLLVPARTCQIDYSYRVPVKA